MHRTVSFCSFKGGRLDDRTSNGTDSFFVLDALSKIMLVSYYCRPLGGKQTGSTGERYFTWHHSLHTLLIIDKVQT